MSPVASSALGQNQKSSFWRKSHVLSLLQYYKSLCRVHQSCLAHPLRNVAVTLLIGHRMRDHIAPVHVPAFLYWLPVKYCLLKLTLLVFKRLPGLVNVISLFLLLHSDSSDPLIGSSTQVQISR